jgi:hypothetical protein
LLQENSTKKLGEWKFIFSQHVFDRMAERGNFSFTDQDKVLENIKSKLSGLRIGEYGFSSKRFNKIFVCEVNPLKKTVKLITVLNGDMKLKQGTGKVITENTSIIDID